MDFSQLTAREVDGLNGARREAWYAWRRGDAAKAQLILETYGLAERRGPSAAPEAATNEPPENAARPAARGRGSKRGS